MQKYVKLVLCLVTLCLGASLCAGTEAQAKIKRGKWKDNISWSYDTNKKELVLTGKGAIAEAMCRNDDYPDVPEWEVYAYDAKSVKIQGRIKKISNYFAGVSGFQNVKILKLTDCITGIGNCAFRSTRKLEKITFPQSLVKIGNEAFSHSGLRKVVIPKRVEKIGKRAFSYSKSLRCVTVKQGVKSTGIASFYCCNKLESVKLPKSLEKIEANAFNTTALREVTIPENVVEIGDGAFDQKWVKKKTLKKVTIKSKKMTKWGKDIFNGASRDLVIYVPASKKLQYELALRAKGLPTYVKIVGETSLD